MHPRFNFDNSVNIAYVQNHILGDTLVDHLPLQIIEVKLKKSRLGVIQNLHLSVLNVHRRNKL